MAKRKGDEIEVVLRKKQKQSEMIYMIKFKPKFNASVYNFLICMQKIFSCGYSMRNIKRQLILLLTGLGGLAIFFQ